MRRRTSVCPRGSSLSKFEDMRIVLSAGVFMDCRRSKPICNSCRVSLSVREHGIGGFRFLYRTRERYRGIRYLVIPIKPRPLEVVAMRLQVVK
jgi:hypothetical protein